MANGFGTGLGAAVNVAGDLSEIQNRRRLVGVAEQNADTQAGVLSERVQQNRIELTGAAYDDLLSKFDIVASELRSQLSALPEDQNKGRIAQLREMATAFNETANQLGPAIGKAPIALNPEFSVEAAQAGEKAGAEAAATKRAGLAPDIVGAEARRERSLTIARGGNIELRRVENPDGSVQLVGVDKLTGDVTDLREPGMILETQQQGIPDKKLRQEAVNREIAARALQFAGKDLLEAVERGGFAAFAAPGSFARLVVGFRDQVSGFAELAGVDVSTFTDGSSTAEAGDKADEIFDKLELEGAAKISAEVKSLIVNLAFAAAMASGQSGRAVSDRDYLKFVEELGAGTGSKEIFVNTVTKFLQRQSRNFSISNEVINNTFGLDRQDVDLFSQIHGKTGSGGGESEVPAGVPPGSTEVRPGIWKSPDGRFFGS